MNITTQDWLDLMPIVKERGWRVTGSRIRDKDGFCPICALLNEVCETNEKELFWWAMRVSEIPVNSREDVIAYAADSLYSRHRTALMHALGMT